MSEDTDFQGALTVSEWRRITNASDPKAAAFGELRELMNDEVDPADPDFRQTLVHAIALLNFLLPPDDGRKLTPDRLALMNGCAASLEGYARHERTDAETRGAQLDNSGKLHRLADHLARYLPPN
jgi:hypothetical protein